MSYLVERLAELRRHLDHLGELRPRVAGRESLERDLSLHNDVLFSLLTVCQLVIDVAKRLPGFRNVVVHASVARNSAPPPYDVFLPLLIATFCSTMVGVLVTARVQGLRLGNPVTLAYLGGTTLLIGLLVAYFGRLDKETLERQASLLANLLIFSVIVGFLLLAARRRVPF